MTLLLSILFLVAWLYTVIVGFKIGLLCGLASIFFTPIAQCIISIFEEDMRVPFMLLLGVTSLMYLFAI